MFSSEQLAASFRLTFVSMRLSNELDQLEAHLVTSSKLLLQLVWASLCINPSSH